MDLIEELLFCCSVSFDGFTIGCSYGMRNFRASLITNIIIGLISAGFTALALFCGRVILMFVPQSAGTYLGAGFLLALGLYTVLCGIFSRNSEQPEKHGRKMNTKESLFVSVAVSVDAFSAGLGFAMSGNPSVWIPLGVGLCHSLFLSLGIIISRKTVNNFCISKKFLTLLSGIIISAVGISRLFL